MAQPRSAAGGDTLTPGRIADTAEPKTGSAAEDRFEDRLDDEDYPAYSMGSAAEMLGVTPTFLRALGAAKLIEPLRSSGGHRRYSRYQLRLAARARELVDQGTPVDAACRIIVLEDQLAEALRINQARERPAAP
ncbi:helix-turn-helix domain-containing protein [Sphaerisporangium aureirubrum]|uniref:MerR family transcriptional regulator n=1 Tax=Sphaerisporangium aureirubrum TaxID=1544736 RepID=A0ABW1NKM3_9ACTN